MKIISMDKGSFAFILGLLLWSGHLRADHSGAVCSALYFQSAITGTVTDSQGPIPGVTVMVKGTVKNTLTDDNGQFSISASPGDVLVFSYIGYGTIEIVADGKPMRITLREDATVLENVVINAGYYTVKDKERTGSIARITAKDIEKQPVTNVLATMQGRMAGVNVTQTTGVPGGSFNIEIRGRNSLRAAGNTPLYIIDGVPFSGDSMGDSDLSIGILGSAGTNPLNILNPTDIESIEILKDADATAIYGSRGANGVVLITTKKAKEGGTTFSVNSYTGIGNVARKLDLLNTQQYLQMREEAFANDGVTELPPWAYDVNGTWDRNRYTDWQKELIGGTAYTKSIDVGISGGSKNTRFMLKGTNYTETTVFPGDFQYGKTAIHTNVDHTSEDSRFRVTFSANYLKDKNNLVAMDMTSLALNLAPNAPAIYDQDGKLNWEASTWDNPFARLEQKYNSQSDALSASASLKYSLPAGFALLLNGGYTDTRLEESNISPSTMYNPAFGLDSSASSVLLNNSHQNSWIIEPQLTWDKEIGRGQLKILAGTTFQERESSQYGIYAAGFPTNSLLDNIAAASQVRARNDNNIVYRYNAIFGRVNYAFDGRYFINVTGRRDGSSRFGSGNRFANFGAVGAAWNFSSETWMASLLPALSFGKLRASYGITGSDNIGDYQYLNTYSITQGSYQGDAGLSPNRLYNPDFSWETNKKLEIALESGFFNDRLFFTAAHYRNRSDNQLVGIPMPGTTGFPSVTGNLNATVENTGWEFELRTLNVKGDKFSWQTSFNITIPRNRLINFPDLAGSTYANQYRIGQPLGIRLVYESLGVDPATGRYDFRDFNSDGQLTSPDDRQKIIDITPDFFGGLQNSFSYKQWKLDFLLQFVKQLGSNYYANTAMPGLANNIPADMLERWQQPGDIKPVQRYSAGFDNEVYNAYTRFTQSDAAYSDASYIRLKNLSLSYDIPTGAVPGVNCRLYLQGQNLLTFTNFKGLDPENQSVGLLPPLRIISIGTQLSF